MGVDPEPGTLRLGRGTHVKILILVKSQLMKAQQHQLLLHQLLPTLQPLLMLQQHQLLLHQLLLICCSSISCCCIWEILGQRAEQR